MSLGEDMGEERQNVQSLRHVAAEKGVGAWAQLTEVLPKKKVSFAGLWEVTRLCTAGALFYSL